MRMIAHVNPNTQSGPHASLWGYTDPEGIEYALFGSEVGTYIYDITSMPIRQVAYIAGETSIWREMKTYKTFAYIGTEAGPLQVLDLSTLPDTARLVEIVSNPVANVHTLYVRDHYLYAMGAPGAGAFIMDLEPDPVHPRLVSKVSTAYFHDAFSRNDTLVGAAIYGEGAQIWDIRDKANPVQMGLIQYPGSGTHNAELTADGHYVVTSDEIGTTAKTMKVWDIRDLDAITKVADFTPSPDDIIHNVHMIGHYAYVAWYSAGVRIIDMIDPVHPREVAFYDTFGGPGGVYDGVWEVYAQFASGKIIASDRASGLWVLAVEGNAISSVAGRSATGTIAIAPNPVAAGGTIDLDTRESGTFELFDPLGRRAMSADIPSGHGQVRLASDLAPGLYLARVISRSGVRQAKVMVE
jgi:choice-of-anchor B domain-containing protein